MNMETYFKGTLDLMNEFEAGDLSSIRESIDFLGRFMDFYHIENENVGFPTLFPNSKSLVSTLREVSLNYMNAHLYKVEGNYTKAISEMLSICEDLELFGTIFVVISFSNFISRKMRFFSAIISSLLYT